MNSDSVPTVIRPDPTGRNRGQRWREGGIFPTLFRLWSDPDPTVFEVNTVGSGRCSREVGSGSEQVRVEPSSVGGKRRTDFFIYTIFETTLGIGVRRREEA